MNNFKVGDKVTIPLGALGGAHDGSMVTLSPHDVGTIVSIDENGSPMWPVSVTVEGKPVECWEDEAWHFNFDELQLVN